MSRIDIGRLGTPAGMSQSIATQADVDELTDEDYQRLANAPAQTRHNMKSSKYRRQYGPDRNGNLGYDR